jgi:hypothetical protein
MRLAESNIVRLIWVPGHHDKHGNEIADELAREGSTTDLVGPEPALPNTLTGKVYYLRRGPTETHSILEKLT